MYIYYNYTLYNSHLLSQIHKKMWIKQHGGFRRAPHIKQIPPAFDHNFSFTFTRRLDSVKDFEWGEGWVFWCTQLCLKPKFHYAPLQILVLASAGSCIWCLDTCLLYLNYLHFLGFEPLYPQNLCMCCMKSLHISHFSYLKRFSELLLIHWIFATILDSGYCCDEF